MRSTRAAQRRSEQTATPDRDNSPQSLDAASPVPCPDPACVAFDAQVVGNRSNLTRRARHQVGGGPPLANFQWPVGMRVQFGGVAVLLDAQVAVEPHLAGAAPQRPLGDAAPQHDGIAVAFATHNQESNVS